LGVLRKTYLHWVDVQDSAKGLTLTLVARASMGEAEAALEKRAAAPATMEESCMLAVWVWCSEKVLEVDG
jgi:hypothetical protein